MSNQLHAFTSCPSLEPTKSSSHGFSRTCSKSQHQYQVRPHTTLHLQIFKIQHQLYTNQQYTQTMSFTTGAGTARHTSTTTDLFAMIDEHLAWQLQSSSSSHSHSHRDSQRTLIVDWDGTGEPKLSWREEFEYELTGHADISYQQLSCRQRRGDAEEREEEGEEQAPEIPAKNPLRLNGQGRCRMYTIRSVDAERDRDAEGKIEQDGDTLPNTHWHPSATPSRHTQRPRGRLAAEHRSQGRKEKARGEVQVQVQLRYDCPPRRRSGYRHEHGTGQYVRNHSSTKYDDRCANGRAKRRNGKGKGKGKRRSVVEVLRGWVGRVVRCE